MISQVRKVRLEFGGLGDATGSCQVEFGGTKVLCAVTGPTVPVRSTVFNEKGTLKCAVQFAPWAKKSGDGGASNNEQNAVERQLSSSVYDALIPTVLLDPYPKAEITVHVMILQASGGELAASITAASLALADAAIECRDMVCACTVVECGDGMVVDPERTELKDEVTGSLVLAKTFNRGTVTQVVQSGGKSAKELDIMIGLADKGCDSLKSVLQKFMKDRYMDSDTAMKVN